MISSTLSSTESGVAAVLGVAEASVSVYVLK
jgi:hypothetical protein